MKNVGTQTNGPNDSHHRKYRGDPPTKILSYFGWDPLWRIYGVPDEWMRYLRRVGENDWAGVEMKINELARMGYNPLGLMCGFLIMDTAFSEPYLSQHFRGCSGRCTNRCSGCPRKPIPPLYSQDALCVRITESQRLAFEDLRDLLEAWAKRTNRQYVDYEVVSRHEDVGLYQIVSD